MINWRPSLLFIFKDYLFNLFDNIRSLKLIRFYKILNLLSRTKFFILLFCDFICEDNWFWIITFISNNNTNCRNRILSWNKFVFKLWIIFRYLNLFNILWFNLRTILSYYINYFCYFRVMGFKLLNVFKFLTCSSHYINPVLTSAFNSSPLANANIKSLLLAIS